MRAIPNVQFFQALHLSSMSRIDLVIQDEVCQCLQKFPLGVKDQGPFTQTLKWLGMKNLALAHYAVCTIREL